MCDKILAEELIFNSERLVNKTGVIFETEDFFENMYNLFDAALIITRVTQTLHPLTFHCWNAAELLYGHYYRILVDENGIDIKNYLMNMVYNFGSIFESCRDVWLFFAEDPRG